MEGKGEEKVKLFENVNYERHLRKLNTKWPQKHLSIEI